MSAEWLMRLISVPGAGAARGDGPEPGEKSAGGRVRGGAASDKKKTPHPSPRTGRSRFTSPRGEQRRGLFYLALR